eukprot:1223177-Pleurochrysis_carterae.AAC.1
MEAAAANAQSKAFARLHLHLVQPVRELLAKVVDVFAHAHRQIGVHAARADVRRVHARARDLRPHTAARCARVLSTAEAQRRLQRADASSSQGGCRGVEARIRTDLAGSAMPSLAELQRLPDQVATKRTERCALSRPTLRIYTRCAATSS